MNLATKLVYDVFKNDDLVVLLDNFFETAKQAQALRANIKKIIPTKVSAEYYAKVLGCAKGSITSAWGWRDSNKTSKVTQAKLVNELIRLAVYAETECDLRVLEPFQITLLQQYFQGGGKLYANKLVYNSKHQVAPDFDPSTFIRKNMDDVDAQIDFLEEALRVKQEPLTGFFRETPEQRAATARLSALIKSGKAISKTGDMKTLEQLFDMMETELA